MRRSSFVWPHWQCQQTPVQMIQTYRVFSSPVVRVTSFQALEVTPAIKQAVTVPCGATSSTDVRTALRLTVEPVCLKWHAYFVFRLFLLLEAFVWGFCMLYLERIIVRLERRERSFSLWAFFSLMGLCLQNSSNMKQKGVHLYTSGKHLPLFPYWPFCTTWVIKNNCNNKDCLLLFFITIIGIIMFN